MFSIGVVKFWSLKFETKMKKSNFESWFNHVGEAQMFKIGRTFFLLPPVWSKNTEKHPIFRGGPAPPKSYHFAKRFLPRYFSPRKPPRNEFWASFLKTEILLGTTLSLIILFSRLRVFVFNSGYKMEYEHVLNTQKLANINDKSKYSFPF